MRLTAVEIAEKFRTALNHSACCCVAGKYVAIVDSGDLEALILDNQEARRIVQEVANVGSVLHVDTLKKAAIKWLKARPPNSRAGKPEDKDTTAIIEREKAETAIAEKGTYTATIRCDNCGVLNEVEIPKGQSLTAYLLDRDPGCWFQVRPSKANACENCGVEGALQPCNKVSDPEFQGVPSDCPWCGAALVTQYGSYGERQWCPECQMWVTEWSNFRVPPKPPPIRVTTEGKAS